MPFYLLSIFVRCCGGLPIRWSMHAITEGTNSSVEEEGLLMPQRGSEPHG